MNKYLKIIFSLIILAMLGFSFIWFASFSFRLIFSFDGFSLKSFLQNGFALTDRVRSFPFDILHYSKQYGDVYPKQIKGAWMLSIVAHLFVIALPAYIFTRKKTELYGSARFATLAEARKADLLVPVSDLKKGGLFAGARILVGRLGKHYLGLAGQMFVYLAAPTRSGKGRAVVVPVCLSYSHSIVALDVKQELFETTGAFRAANGHDVYLVNPFATDGRTARWNPFSYVRRDDALRIDDINSISISLIPDGSSDDSFFTDSARSLFLGLALYCFDKEAAYKDYTPTIKAILDLASDIDGEAIPYFVALSKDPFVSDGTRKILASSVAAGEKTFASILATLTANLSPWLSPTVANATSGDDFDLREVRRKKTTIYLGILPSDLQKAEKIINLFYSQLINLNTATLPQKDPSLKYQCLLLMDEATAAGRISILSKAISYMAGYGLRLLLVVQSPAQLRDPKLYGEQGTRNIITNMALKIMYKPDDQQDAEEYSKLLGKVTVKTDTQRSRGGGGKGVSRTETHNARDLMMPQELREMNDDKEIISYRLLKHPLMAEKNDFVEDPLFIPRWKNISPLEVKPLETLTSASGHIDYHEDTIAMKDILLSRLAAYVSEELTEAA